MRDTRVTYLHLAAASHQGIKVSRVPNPNPVFEQLNLKYFFFNSTKITRYLGTKSFHCWYLLEFGLHSIQNGITCDGYEYIAARYHEKTCSLIHVVCPKVAHFNSLTSY